MTLTLASNTPATPDALKRHWDALLAAQPQTRIREAAARLNVSEAELLATDCGRHVTRLDGYWPDLLAGAQALGPVMTLTRNDHAVHEKTGLYSHLEECDRYLWISGDQIDLCLLLDRWAFAFAVTENTANGPRYSLQFFGYDGLALHKIYITAESNLDAYQQLVDRFRTHDQSPQLGIDRHATNAGPRLPSELPDHWRADVNAWQAASSNGDGRALTHEGFRNVMQQIADGQCAVSILVANPGALQRYWGPIQTLRITGPWFNVLDAGFNLHLNETAIADRDIVDYSAADARRRALALRDNTGGVVMTVCGDVDEQGNDSAFWQNALAVALS